MSSFIIHSVTRREWSGLAFERDGMGLVCTGTGDGIPDVIVQAFDPDRDVFYSIPSPLSAGSPLKGAGELEEEVRVHFPDVLRQRANGRVFPSTLGGVVLMQDVDGEVPVLSPLASLAMILERTGSVNAAILQADNGGMMFLRRAGNAGINGALHAELSPRSLEEFIEIDEDARASYFPNFIADEIITSGSDIDHFTTLDIAPLTLARRISIEDFAALCQFTPDAMELVTAQPYRYTLAIGAAMLYDEILRQVA